MKKNGIALAIILIILVMTLVACSNTIDATEKSDIDDFIVTIHPNNGDPNVKWDISDPIPKFEKEGFEIEGYYLDSDFTIEVVLTSLKKTGLNGDIDVYIKWKKEECEHDIVIDDAVPATCTEKGLTEGKHCSKCEEVILAQTEVPALGHTSADAVKENEIAPTCTTAGSYDSVVYCSVCDAEISRETITVDALGHKWIWIVDKNATVTETGLKHEECSVCHIKRNENTTIDILDCSHQGSLVHHEQVDATCTEDGTIEYWHCTACDKKHTDAAGQIIAETIVIPSTGHTGGKAVQENVVAATCTTAGSYDSVVYCSVCDAELSRETKSVDALDHNIVNHNAQAPTCTEVGWNAYETCSRCDYTTYAEIPATGHNHVPVVTVPTCTEKGYTTYTCHCGDTYIADEVPATGHDYEADVIDPTCTEKGYTIYTCHCGDAYVADELPATGHDPAKAVVENNVAPTCTAAGSYDSVVYCSVCDTVLSRTTITVDALGHDTIDHEAQAPTCTEVGWNAYETCSRCDYTTYEEIPATGHTYSSDCDIVCNVCEHERVSSVSHTYDNSCDTTCNDCGAVRTIDHTYDNNCDATCNVCGATRTPSSHVYDNTCDTTCNDCGAVREIEHTYSSDCDIVCNVCEHERVPSVSHTYDNSCDTTCNECGATRTIEHTYSSDCDTLCNVCEYERTASINHTHSNACDTTCNVCGTVREIEHTYDNNCDATCNVCRATRTPSSHVYDNTCDTICNECGAVREIEHTYSSDCDIICNVCEFERTDTASHTYFNNCDADCNECGETREVGDHIYDNTCDTTCNECGDVRETRHKYASDCDSICDVCSFEREPLSNHIFDNNCDANCNECGAYFEPSDHIYDDSCDTTCNVCGAVRTIDHTYDNTCDTICNICGDVRTIEHTYSSDCDTICNVCKYERTALVDHTAYYNTCDTTCNECGATRTIEHTYSSDCDTLCNVCKHERVSSVNHTYSSDCDTICNVCETTRTTSTAHSDVNSADNSCDNCGESVSTLTFTLSDAGKSYAITDANSNISGDITIPSTYNGKPVTEIGYEAFYGCNHLTSVTFGENSKLTTIGGRAFYNCTSLTSIVIPDSVTSIGYGAFAYCTSLTSIVIPDSVSTIGSSAFGGCSSLESLTIPFVGAKEGAYQYPFGYLFGTSSYTGGVATTQSTSPTTSPTYYIPSSLKSVTVTGGNILQGAFENCDNITNITLGDDVTTIGSDAFEDCTSLTSIVIPDSVTTIGEKAFYNCTSLTSVTFGESSKLTTIGNDAFMGCNSLTNAYYLGTLEQWCGITFENSSANPMCCADNLYIDGKLLEGELIIPDGIKAIYKYAFYNCTRLTRITIPDSVTTIGYSAFSGCSSLESLTIPFVGNRAGVTSSDTYRYPFGYIFGTSSYTGGVETWQYNYYDTSSSGWTTYYIPSSLKSVTVTGGYITRGAFEDCRYITNMTLSDDVTTIGYEAFLDCTSLTNAYYLGTLEQWCGISFEDSYANPMYYADNLYIDGKLVRGKLVIPDEVTSIPTCAFRGQTITSITIPDSVTRIGSYAFDDCTSLTSVTFGENSKLTTIGYGAFSGCTRLTSITIPDSVTSIGDEAFGGCSSLKSLTIPCAGAIEGGYHYPLGYLFGTSSYTGGVATTQYVSSTSLTTSKRYYIPSSLKSVTVTGGYIPRGAFENCDNITNITLGDDVTTIYDGAFRNCDDLTSIVIPDSVTSIGASAFYNCTNLTSVAFGENSQLTIIHSSAFYNCSSLASITIPDSVTRIGSEAFGGCSSLESLTIPFAGAKVLAYQDPLGDLFGTSSYTGGVATTQYSYNSGTLSTTSITYYIPSSLKSVTVTGGYILRGAFYNCNNITNITLGDDVTSIGYDAFYNCTSLRDVYYTGDIAGWCGISFSNANANPMCCADNLYIDGKLVEGELVIPDSETRIGGSTFSGCTSLTSIVIPDSVTSIGASAFYNCTSLTSITIPDSVTTIGSEAFGGCSSLESLTIPFVGNRAGVTSSDTYQYPFGYLFGTSSYTGGVETTQGYYGDSTSSTTSTTYYIPSSLKSVTVTGGNILYGAFFDCKNITNITLGDDVTTIGRSTFYDCTSLTSVTFGENSRLTSIGDYAFYNCTSLTSITIPDSVTIIGEEAFYNCSSLASITIPDSVTRIGLETFRGCSSLESLTIPFVGALLGRLFGTSSYTGGVATLQYNYYDTPTTYYIPSSLKSVTVTGGDIPTGAFENCDNITNITLGDSVTSIGEDAFYDCTSLTSIVIPNSVTRIGDYAFSRCTSLKDVYYTGTKEQWKNITIGTSNGSLTNATIHFYTVVNENVIEATCTTVGSYDSVTYSYDGTELSRKTIVVPSLGHDIVNHEAKAPTCTEVGWEAYEACSRCDHTTYAEIPATGHTESAVVVENNVAPTCTATGSYDNVVYCSVCDAELSRTTITVDALGHDVINHIAQAPTCTEIGWNAYETCSRCDHTTYAEIPALGHDKVGHEAQAPTCTEIGWEAYETCSRCEHSTYTEIPATGHSPAAAVIENNVAPTCTTAGSYDSVVYCSVCDVELSREAKTVAATGHSHNAVVTAPTCTEEGYTTYTCHCGDTYVVDEVDALGHAIVNHEAKAPTCTEIGWEAYETCSRCDHTTYAEIPALGHDIVDHEAKAPTCTEIGWNAYETCSRCDHTTYAEIPATGHTESVAVVENNVAPTCTATGSYDKVVYCATCGEELSSEHVIVDVLGHDVINHEAQAPTCTEIGWEAYETCSRCDHTTYTEIPATGHTERAAVRENYIPATCTEEGSYDRVVYCSVCGEELSRDAKIISASHTPTSAVQENVVKATCTTNGSYDSVVYCSVCDEELSRDTVIISASHTPASAVQENVIESTCVTEGSYDEVVYCSVCSQQLSKETITLAVSGHAYEVTGKCQVCGYQEFVFKTNSDGGLTITGLGTNFTGDMLVIPSELAGYPVTQIGQEAFKNNETITSVFIPGTVHTICGGGMAPMDKGAFARCTNLETVIFGANSAISSIEATAFYNCSALTIIYFQGSRSQWDAVSISSLGNSSIKEDAMVYCATESVTFVLSEDKSGYIVAGVNQYNMSAEIGIPSMFAGKPVVGIADRAFYASSIVKIAIPHTVTYIGASAFEGCGQLNEISFNDCYQLRTIGSFAFRGCTSLTSIVIPDRVTTIGEGAFEGCTNLLSVVAPVSITSIGDYAFEGCVSLKDVYYEGSETQIGAISIGSSNSSLFNATIHYNYIKEQ